MLHPVYILAVSLANGITHTTASKVMTHIVGGHDVTIDNYPYMISFQYYGQHICGGSIVSSKHVVTAAHCTYGQTLRFISVRAGSSTVGIGGQVVSARDAVHHPRFSKTAFDYDVAVLHLASDLILSPGSHAAAIRIIRSGTVLKPGTMATVTGWGYISDLGPRPRVLQAVEVPIMAAATCAAGYAPSPVTSRMICAGYASGGKDSCQGDSGGPLARAGGSLVGIVSWGDGCAEAGHPGVYTRLSHPEINSFVLSEVA